MITYKVFLNGLVSDYQFYKFNPYKVEKIQNIEIGKRGYHFYTSKWVAIKKIFRLVDYYLYCYPIYQGIEIHKIQPSICHINSHYKVGCCNTFQFKGKCKLLTFIGNMTIRIYRVFWGSGF